MICFGIPDFTIHLFDSGTYSFGLPTLLFALVAAIVGFLLFETVNYIEHYGFLRQKMPSGRYERVREDPFLEQQSCHGTNHFI